MKKTIIALAFALKACTPCPAAELSREQVASLSSAIYKAEGGAKASVPYGILSVKVSGKDEARRVCENTIRNNWRRWQDAGAKGSYVDFLADRYCPPSADKQGNVNWKRNVKSNWKEPKK